MRALLSIPLLIFAALSGAACSAQAAPPVLRLATWNLEHLAADSNNGCRRRSDADYARLRYHATSLNADVIALQEVENAAAVAHLFDPGIYAIEVSDEPDRDLGTCRRQRNQRRTMQRTGFAIHRKRLAELGLSYHRLPDIQALALESQRRAARILLKPADSTGAALHLLSLHLKSGCAYGRLDGEIERRQCKLLVQQRGILEEWIDARASAGERFVMLGDFNRQLDQPNDDFWADIDDESVCDWTPDPALGRRCRPGTARSNSDADLTLANAGNPFPFPHNPRYPYAIDHIVFDPVTAGRLITASYRVLDYEGDDPAPSDHHPISISLRWTKR